MSKKTSQPEQEKMMSVSEVSICNLALGKLGADFIESLAERSKEGGYCARFYPAMRDAVLRSCVWGFALRWKSLGPPLSEPPAMGFSLAYQYPADCLLFLGLSDPGVPWARVGDTIRTNQPRAEGAYTARVRDPNLFDPLFVNALAARLAAELAEPIAQSTTKAKNMLKLYQECLAEARLANAFECGRISGNGSLAEPEDGWLAARHGAAGGGL